MVFTYSLLNLAENPCRLPMEYTNPISESSSSSLVSLANNSFSFKEAIWESPIIIISIIKVNTVIFKKKRKESEIIYYFQLLVHLLISQYKSL